jgi:hypothetical protein
MSGLFFKPIAFFAEERERERERVRRGEWSRQILSSLSWTLRLFLEC